MDWSQIMSLVSNIVLAGFTIVLAIATIKLCQSTKRYSKATERMERISRLNFVDGIFRHVYTGVPELANLQSHYSKMLLRIGRENAVIPDLPDGKQIGFMKDRLSDIHTILTWEELGCLSRQVSDDVFRDIPGR